MDPGILLLAALAGIIILLALLLRYWRRRRRAALIDKYGDEKVADLIMAGKVWQGMSEEQLRDSWGSPADLDEKLYKSKSSLTYKYGQTGKNRFAKRVFVENGVVVGWENK